MPAKIIFIIFFVLLNTNSAQIIDSLQSKYPDETTVTVQSILENYIDAVGGRENLSGIIDKRTILKGTSGVTELNIEVLLKAPNKIYQSFTAGPVSQETWFDGEKGRQVAMGREQVFEGIFLESLRIQGELNLELNYQKYGVTPVLSGIDTIDNTEAYKIIWELPSGIEWIYYYEKKSGLLLKQVITHDTGQGRFSQTNFLYDYKEINGVKFPHRFTQIAGGQVFELEVELLEINTGIDDSKFE